MAILITDGKHSYEFEYTLPEAPWPSSRAPQSSKRRSAASPTCRSYSRRAAGRTSSGLTCGDSSKTGSRPPRRRHSRGRTAKARGRTHIRSPRLLRPRIAVAYKGNVALALRAIEMAPVRAGRDRPADHPCSSGKGVASALGTQTKRSARQTPEDRSSPGMGAGRREVEYNLVTRGRRIAAAALVLYPLAFLEQAAAADTAQERLGYTETARVLVLHADDLGMSHSVNVATFDALEKGWITSASILVPCPWFPEVARWAKQHPNADLGIHLALTSEW